MSNAEKTPKVDFKNSNNEYLRPGIQRLDTEVEYVTKELQNYIAQAQNIIHEDDDMESSTDQSKGVSAEGQLSPVASFERDYFNSKVHFSNDKTILNSDEIRGQKSLSTAASPAVSPPASGSRTNRPQHYRFNTSGSDLFTMIDKLNSRANTESNNSSFANVQSPVDNNHFDHDTKIHFEVGDNDGLRHLKGEQAENKDMVDSVTDSLSNSRLEMLSRKQNLYQKTKSHNQLNETAHGVRMLNKDLFNTKFKLQIQNILIVTKHYDDSLIFITSELIEHLLVKYPNIFIYLEEKMFYKNENLELDEIFHKCCMKIENNENINHRVKYYDQQFIQENDNLIDLVITLGGDGTVLYVSNIFQKNVPPVMSFSLGSLGFLTNFEFENYEKSLEKLFTKKITTKLRMRLSCIVVRESTNEIIERQILNELVIDRGPSPFISNLEVYGNGSLLTVAQADGLIIATPTGSTAYSLSAGGSLVYPEVNALCITPICPHTLSFRPIILPDSMILTVKVPKDSRSTAWCSFDGKNRLELFKGDKVYVRASEYSFPTVEARKTEFIDSISRSLNWNQREAQKSLGHLLSGNNKSNYEKEIENKKVKKRSYSGVGKEGLLHDFLELEQLQKLSSDLEEDEEDDDDEEI
ncbi:hypothetical protein QEN19_003452 [Hanseniaspora menglaensis]